MNREQIRRQARAAGAALAQFARSWANSDNISILAGIACVTKGASLFSERAAWLACGSLILGFTLLHLIFGGRR